MSPNPSIILHAKVYILSEKNKLISNSNSNMNFQMRKLHKYCTKKHNKL